MMTIAILLTSAMSSVGDESLPDTKSQLSRAETAVLPNGKTYQVRTNNGMPTPFTSKYIEVTGLGPMFEATTKKGEWVFFAKLREAGQFSVTVTSHNDEAVFDSFDCIGPGEVLARVFSSDKYPTMWAWFEQPGTYWVHFQFNFADKKSGKNFVVTQWTKFGIEAKITLRRALKQHDGK